MCHLQRLGRPSYTKMKCYLLPKPGTLQEGFNIPLFQLWKILHSSWKLTSLAGTSIANETCDGSWGETIRAVTSAKLFTTDPLAKPIAPDHLAKLFVLDHLAKFSLPNNLEKLFVQDAVGNFKLVQALLAMI